jgi:hypothetical protein
MHMTYTTLEAEIDHGQVTVRERDKLPDHGRGLLIILPATQSTVAGPRTRVRLPLIQGDGQRMINPTAEELDGSLWD